MRVAVIEDGQVLNVIRADQEFIDSVSDSYAEYKSLGPLDNVSIGDLYSEGSFTKPAPVPRPYDYKDERKRAYPKVGEQLDMIYHAMASGEIPKASEWFDIIDGIKTAHPKPITEEKA